MKTPRNKPRNIQRSILMAVALLLAAVLLSLIIWGIYCIVKGQVEQSPTNQITSVNQVEYQLADGLVLVGIGKYTGAYMEDGSNEIVSGILMAEIRNTSHRDLQYARLQVQYQNTSAQFVISNLPAGETMIALEENRHDFTEEKPKQVRLLGHAWFQKHMDSMNGTLYFSGGRGAMTVENRSDQDIVGDLYIYYKYVTDNVLYGGITFRTAIEGGLKAGESKVILAGHYDEDTCVIVDVVTE